MESILTSIKKLLGITKEYDQFDMDIVMHINSVFFILNQLGIGPEEGFTITDEYAKWSDYIPDGKNLELIKSYMYLKVRLLFDPPLNNAIIEGMKAQINEYEFRLNVAAENQSNSEEGIQNG